MISLLPLMIEKVGIIIVIAAALSNTAFFRNVINGNKSAKDMIFLVLLFSTFGIVSNLTGVEIANSNIISNGWNNQISNEGAIANTRIMAVGIGGLLGGPVVGFCVGLISGINRMALGGFTAVACSVSSIIAGVISGVVGNTYRKRQKPITPWLAVLLGVSLELFQMGIILLVARPFDMAVSLVAIIAIPMSIINAAGNFIFLSIIQSVQREEARVMAQQTQLALSIADESMPYFRKGLTRFSGEKVTKILYGLIGADAVIIMKRDVILAQEGKYKESLNGKGATTDILLDVKEQNIGVIKIYFENANRLSQAHRELTRGLSKLFSAQLELAQAENQAHLLKDAEIKALQAQVNPHFLFNAINTVSALCRTDPEKARELLQELATYFRSNLQGAREHFITLEQELQHIRAYLTLEQTRFPDKFEIVWLIDDNLQSVMIPPFTLQILIENACTHGFSKAKQRGKIAIRIQRKDEKVTITVEDNGLGIPKARLDKLGKETIFSENGTGTALLNMNQRLKGLYGKEGTLAIDSEEGAGTKVSFVVPYEWE